MVFECLCGYINIFKTYEAKYLNKLLNQVEQIAPLHGKSLAIYNDLPAMMKFLQLAY